MKSIGWRMRGSWRGIIGGVALAAMSCAPSVVDAAPNVIVILADDLGYGELSSYGQQHYTTPNVDRLAREGMRFTQHYAGSAVCAPSRATLMTGRHTGHVSVRNNFGRFEDGSEGRVPLSRAETTVAEFLREAGYVSAIIGKWGLGDEGSGSEPWARGFDHFHGFLDQAHAHNHYPEFLYLEDRPVPIPENFGHKETVYANDRFTDGALRWIESNAHRPFFLYLAYTTPHADLKCPEDSVRETRDAFPALAAPGTAPSSLIFASMVRRLDRDVGRVLDLLERLEIAENTLVVFTSDNGPHDQDGKDNDSFASAGPFRGIKRDLYEGGIRVPFIARWPRRIQPATTCEQPSAFWDFLPTLAEILGRPAPESAVDGISFAPALLDRPGPQEERTLYWELTVKNRGRQAVRSGDWKLLRNGTDRPWELYDLVRDRGETQNLADLHPEIVSSLASRIPALRTESPVFPLHGQP